MVVRDIERDEIEFISKTLGCMPVAHIEQLKPEKLGSAELVEEIDVSGEPVCTAGGCLARGCIAVGALMGAAARGGSVCFGLQALMQTLGSCIHLAHTPW
jgi:T-complex protein 1 subunit delta